MIYRDNHVNDGIIIQSYTVKGLNGPVKRKELRVDAGDPGFLQKSRIITEPAVAKKSGYISRFLLPSSFACQTHCICLLIRLIELS